MLRDPATHEQVEKFQAEYVPQQMAERVDKGLRLCEVAEQYFDTLLHKGIHGSERWIVKRLPVHAQPDGYGAFIHIKHPLKFRLQDQASHCRLCLFRRLVFDIEHNEAIDIE